jgi:hypothetical protein
VCSIFVWPWLGIFSEYTRCNLICTLEVLLDVCSYSKAKRPKCSEIKREQCAMEKQLCATIRDCNVIVSWLDDVIASNDQSISRHMQETPLGIGLTFLSKSPVAKSKSLLPDVGHDYAEEGEGAGARAQPHTVGDCEDFPGG